MDNLFAKALRQEVADLQAVGYPHSNACAAVSAARVGLMISELGEMLEALPQGQQEFFQPEIKAVFGSVLLVGMHCLMDNKLEEMSIHDTKAECERVGEIVEKIFDNLNIALEREILRVAEVEAPPQ